jgi:hypothetical protein
MLFGHFFIMGVILLVADPDMNFHIQNMQALRIHKVVRLFDFS